MRFNNPNYLLLIFFIVFFCFFEFFRLGCNRRIFLRFLDLRVKDKMVSAINTRNRKMKIISRTLVLLLIVLALARPQWGARWQEASTEGLDIVIAVDVSKSMLAEDVLPSRLERCKLALGDFLKKLKGDRIALVAFSGAAFIQCPLTSDYSGFRLALSDLDADIIPREGTSIAEAIEEGLKAFEANNPSSRVLIVITDGEDHQGRLKTALLKAKEMKVKIFPIGIGTVEGELIKLTDERGESYYLKDKSGNVVKSRLNETVLREIAQDSGGVYVTANAIEFGLDYLFEKKISQLQKVKTNEKMEKVYIERFQIPLALAILLLCFEPCLREAKDES